MGTCSHWRVASGSRPIPYYSAGRLGVFFAAAFLAAAFFAAGEPAGAGMPLLPGVNDPLGAFLTEGPVFGSFLLPLTRSLKPWPGRKRGTVVFLTLTLSPVCGLRANRAGRSTFSNVPKPVTETRSPRGRWCRVRRPPLLRQRGGHQAVRQRPQPTELCSQTTPYGA